jgi:hypothetical protein
MMEDIFEALFGGIFEAFLEPFVELFGALFEGVFALVAGAAGLLFEGAAATGNFIASSIQFLLEAFFEILSSRKNDPATLD